MTLLGARGDTAGEALVDTQPDTLADALVDTLVDALVDTLVTPRIESFLAAHPELPTPFLVVDLDVVAERYEALRAALPGADVFYAVKANPDLAVISALAELGCSFDVASLGEIELCLGLGVPAEAMSYGNTVKKERDLVAAIERGVRIVAVDCEAELDKVLRHLDRGTALVRLASDGGGADWPLSRKFGCSETEAAALLRRAAEHGLDVGLCFHVGSQQRDVLAWDEPLAAVARLAAGLAAEGHRLSVVNLGGGLPSSHYLATPEMSGYGLAISRAMTRHLGDLDAAVMIEPGRYLVGDAGVLRSEVILVCEKDSDHDRRWVYLDAGVFTGLIETQDEAVRYRMRFPGSSGDLVPCVVAGPTCDSVDVLYEQIPYPMPADLAPGSFVDILSTGAYTTTYSSVWFNGFGPLRAYHLPRTE